MLVVQLGRPRMRSTSRRPVAAADGERRAAGRRRTGTSRLPEASEGELRLRPREHRAPGLERRPSARRPRPRRRAARALVDALVVGHVAAAAQDDANGPETACQPRISADLVEVGAAARADDRPPRGRRSPRRSSSSARSSTRSQERRRRGERSPFSPVQDPLVPLDAGELERAASRPTAAATSIASSSVRRPTARPGTRARRAPAAAAAAAFERLGHASRTASTESTRQ